MSLIGDLLRKKDPVEQAYEELDTELDDAFSVDLTDDLAEPDDGSSKFAMVAEATREHQSPSTLIEATPLTTGDALTPHAQARMAAFKVFDDGNRATRDELARIGKAFTNIVMSYNVGRDFLENCQQEIIRASELEHANNRFAVENRRLLERGEKQERHRERLEDLIEAMKRRETRLQQDADTLRETLADIRMELVETRNSASSAEAARSEMLLSLAGRSAEGERQQREMDDLREKNASLTAELDQNQKRLTEARRRLEEVQTAQSVDAVRLSELANKLVAEEKEAQRLQRQNDLSEAQLVEVNDARRTAEQDLRDSERRYQAELQAVRTELEQWKSRFQAVAANTLVEAALAIPPVSETDFEADGDLDTDADVAKESAPAHNGRRRQIRAAAAE